jgi:hypothetical protein
MSGTIDRDYILAEIKRTTAANQGQALGRGAFARETGIRERDWYGRYWVRWSEAIIEAGFSPNEMQSAFPVEALLRHLAVATRELGHFPSRAEQMLRRRTDSTFPSDTVFARRFGSRRETMLRLEAFCVATPDFGDVVDLLDIQDSAVATVAQAATIAAFGSVYMLKAGRNYKIGRSNAFGRREREIALQLPQRADTVHVIKTDDPEGIEAYWHHRFKSKRANGEWFTLSAEDVAAFRRRKFM